MNISLQREHPLTPLCVHLTLVGCQTLEYGWICSQEIAKSGAFPPNYLCVMILSPAV